MCLHAEKNRIISALGESRLLLPAPLSAALAAGEQVKYLFALLQNARHRADHPHAGFSSLYEERLACGLDDADELDLVIAGSRPEGEDAYRIAQADRSQADSRHLLVADAHKALGRLQASMAAETIDGAKVYEIKSGERTLIRSFMRGVNQTAALKFDHAGLGTTATHANERLVVQNDLGITEARVLVVHVSELTAVYSLAEASVASFRRNCRGAATPEIFSRVALRKIVLPQCTNATCARSNRCAQCRSARALLIEGGGYAACPISS